MFANVIVPRKRYNKQRIMKLADLTVDQADDEKGLGPLLSDMLRCARVRGTYGFCLLSSGFFRCSLVA